MLNDDGLGDGAEDVPRDAVLSWDPGQFAKTHDVCFGTVLADVNTASRISPKSVLVSQGQDAAAYVPGLLAFGQTYYWRFDELDAPSGGIITKGSVWSFTAEPVAYPIPVGSVTATASSSDTGKGPENAVNGSGLDSDGLHGNVGDGAMWLSAAAGPQPTGILFEFDKIRKLREMWVWNSNESLEKAIGLGFKEVAIEYSIECEPVTLSASIPLHLVGVSRHQYL